MKRTGWLLCAALLLAPALLHAKGNAEPPTPRTPTDDTRLGAFVARPAKGLGVQPASAAVYESSDWESRERVLSDATDKALEKIGESKPTPEDVIVQAALRNPGESLLRLDNYDLEKVPGEKRGLKFAVSIEVVPAPGNPSKIQTFESPLVIRLVYPEGSDPFFVTPDKQGRVYLKDMAKGTATLPGFDGHVESAQEGREYTITVKAWTAGDPCCSG
ncbi:MAG TPA: hypothetical protein VMF68_08985 [Spirochaetia bacterium]|nr:hypothetical protein [Spirochaetia bacterium]